MDDGPLRSRQPARRPVSRPPEPVKAPQPTPRPHTPQPEPVYEAPAPVAVPTRRAAPKKEKSKKSSKKFLLPIAGLIVIGIAGWLVWSMVQGGNTGIKSNQYQAVFFTNGQVYFGKLSPLNGESMKLTDVYYLQSNSADSTDSDEVATNENKLIKLGDEVHAPEDELVILKSQIQFYENLKDDGQVAQTIKANENK